MSFLPSFGPASAQTIARDARDPRSDRIAIQRRESLSMQQWGQIVLLLRKEGVEVVNSASSKKRR
jgi:hypothetical protein